MTVTLGAHNIKAKEETQQIIPVAKAIPHPAFNRKHGTNDIMLLKVRHATISCTHFCPPLFPITYPCPLVCALLGAGRASPSFSDTGSSSLSSILTFKESQASRLLAELVSPPSSLPAGE
jgi:hypothetical protein